MSPKARPFVLYGSLIGALALSGTFAYGAVAGGSPSSTTNTRTVTVQKGTVSQVVSADGSLTPAADLTLDFGTAGTVTEIDVAPGATVTAGQVLAKLDPTSQQEALAIAQLNLTGAQNKVAQAEAGTSTAGGGSTGGSSGGSSSGVTQATVDADQTALDDAQKTAAINANGYQLAIDQAQGDLASAQQHQQDDQQACANDSTSPACAKASDDADAVRKAQDDLANAQQAQAAGAQRDQVAIHEAEAKLAADQAAVQSARSAPATTTPATVDASAVASARSALLSAQNQVTAAQKALDATTLTAPSAGTITTIDVAVGDQVSGNGNSAASGSSGASGNAAAGGGSSSSSSSSSASSSSGKSFGTLLDTTGYSVTVALPEADAPKVKAGQPATITVSAVDSAGALDGTVSSIAATSTTTNNVVSYKTVVSIADPPAELRTGMSASVSIAVASKSDVVAVSTAAITTRAGSSFVNKLVNGKPVETQVTTGLQGDSTTEITSGLVPGDQVTIATATVSATTGTRGNGGGTLTGGGTGGGFGGGQVFGPGAGPGR